MMATFVLIGGAWIGAWAWKDVTRNLREHGHEVYPLSLTGLGERGHLGNGGTNLTTHITDVINLIEFEDLDDVYLVCHSYSGIVAPGVIDRIPERLAGAIYVDTMPLPNGMRMIDFNSEEGQAEQQKKVDAEGEGWKFFPPKPDELGQGASVRGMSADDLALFGAKAVPHPYGTYIEPLRLTREAPPDLRNLVVQCDDSRAILGSLGEDNPMLAFLKEPNWSAVELQTGHWPMLSEPVALADILDRFAN